ncbi:hypothetical protein niasHT_005683 [Heterodera trifolii]|uniref:Tumor necrosis factor alpha-induced protein 8-like protein n=1 Tax=Heterodera trifolii TaxID=157864 RepID=A0ABD2MAA2_9BILA
MASSDSEASSFALPQNSKCGATATAQKTTANASSSLAMRVQRKVLSKLSKRGMVRLLGDNRLIALMDALYEMLKEFYDSKTAEKVVKNGIKLIVKVGLLCRENKLSEEQQRLLSAVESEFGRLALTIQSFRKVQFSYNRTFLLSSIDAIHRSILKIVEQTLSEKSAKRVENVFGHFSNDEFLDFVFTSSGAIHTEMVRQFAAELDNLLAIGTEEEGGETARDENSTP